MADSFFGNVLEFFFGYIVFEIVKGVGAILLVFIVPTITGATEQSQIISQLIVANYLMFIVVSALLIWWKKILGISFTLFALMHVLLRVNIIVFLLSLL